MSSQKISDSGRNCCSVIIHLRTGFSALCFGSYQDRFVLAVRMANQGDMIGVLTTRIDNESPPREPLRLSPSLKRTTCVSLSLGKVDPSLNLS